MAATSIEIRLSGISATFHHERRGDITAVKNLDLEVRPGEFLTLLGSSGCGKTTTLRMIAGFQKPSSGRVLFGDEDVTGLAANQRDIGFVFQNYALFPHLSVFENVAYGLRVKRQDAALIESSVDTGLRQVGLHGMGDRMINELSGGQQQRARSEEHTSELQSRQYLVCRLLLETKNTRLNSSHANISYDVFCLEQKALSFPPVPAP